MSAVDAWSIGVLNATNEATLRQSALTGGDPERILYERFLSDKVLAQDSDRDIVELKHAQCKVRHDLLASTARDMEFAAELLGFTSAKDAEVAAREQAIARALDQAAESLEAQALAEKLALDALAAARAVEAAGRHPPAVPNPVSPPRALSMPEALARTRALATTLVDRAETDEGATATAMRRARAADAAALRQRSAGPP